MTANCKNMSIPFEEETVRRRMAQRRRGKEHILC